MHQSLKEKIELAGGSPPIDQANDGQGFFDRNKFQLAGYAIVGATVATLVIGQIGRDPVAPALHHPEVARGTRYSDPGRRMLLTQDLKQLEKSVSVATDIAHATDFMSLLERDRFLAQCQLISDGALVVSANLQNSFGHTTPEDSPVFLLGSLEQFTFSDLNASPERKIAALLGTFDPRVQGLMNYSISASGVTLQILPPRIATLRSDVEENLRTFNKALSVAVELSVQ